MQYWTHARRQLLTFVLTLCITQALWAQDGGSFMQALEGTTPLLDLRLRHEEVQQVGLPSNADANTLRLRLGGATGAFLGTTLLVEGEAMVKFDRSYRPDNAVTTYIQFPVIADPNNLVINRLALINKSLPKTTVTVGRQRIQLDDQRFVGNSGWRQNEVTFDALRIVNQSIPNFTLDMTVLDRINRQYGHDSPQGTYKGTSFLFNGGYRLPLGIFTGFAYLVELDPIAGLNGALDPRRGSTSTVGGRLAGGQSVSHIQFGYTLSYAQERPRGDNPLQFRDSYLLAEAKAGIGDFTLTLGDEILHGNGVVGFTTPLATLHSFQGWADKFLTTPAAGIDDRYASLGWTHRHLAHLDSVTATAVYHEFEAEQVAVEYGKELDFLIAAKWHHYTVTLKYADYSSASATPLALARDTEKFWVQMEYSL